MEKECTFTQAQMERQSEGERARDVVAHKHKAREESPAETEGKKQEGRHSVVKGSVMLPM